MSFFARAYYGRSVLSGALSSVAGPSGSETPRRAHHSAPDEDVCAEHGRDVTEMNEVRRRASEWVQRAPAKPSPLIDKPGHPDRSTS
jgi:hypothetical protein